eukprot:6192553-Pleurochrysis_carterae.AAC.3
MVTATASTQRVRQRSSFATHSTCPASALLLSRQRQFSRCRASARTWLNGKLRITLSNDNHVSICETTANYTIATGILVYAETGENDTAERGREGASRAI